MSAFEEIFPVVVASPCGSTMYVLTRYLVHAVVVMGTEQSDVFAVSLEEGCWRAPPGTPLIFSVLQEKWEES